MGLDAIDSNTLRALDAGSHSSPAVSETASRREPESRAGAPQPESLNTARPPIDGVPRRLGVQQQLPPNTRLRVDAETNQIVAQILDENNEVIRQIPPEALLELSSRFTRLEGLLFNRES